MIIICFLHFFFFFFLSIIPSSTSVQYNLPDKVNTVQESTSPQRLLVYGRFLVFNNKPNDLTIHLDSIARNDFILPPVSYVKDLRCINLVVYGLDKDGNCEAGCGAVCDLPSGQGKENIITAVSEKERIR